MHENHFSPRYSSFSPVRACMMNPPMPAAFMSSIWRHSSASSRLLFHDQNGMLLYASKSPERACFHSLFICLSPVSLSAPFRRTVRLYCTIFRPERQAFGG